MQLPPPIIIISVSVFVFFAALVGVVALMFRRATAGGAEESIVGGSINSAGASQGMTRRSSKSSFGLSTILPTSEERRKELGDRLVRAGLYKRNSRGYYLAVRSMLAIFPLLGGVMIGLVGIVPMMYGFLLGAATSLLGTLIPTFWLDHHKRRRQVVMRRSLPDALDVIVICVEGGLSVPAAVSRVGRELHTAHPLLATELRIVDREIQMGHSTGEALQRMADRFDVEELRSLATVLRQAEKFGASIANALRVFAETSRVKRFQMAEERAQKATVKLLFPTIFFIFPSIYLVLLGPAVIGIVAFFQGLKMP